MSRTSEDSIKSIIITIYLKKLQSADEDTVMFLEECLLDIFFPDAVVNKVILHEMMKGASINGDFGGRIEVNKRIYNEKTKSIEVEDSALSMNMLNNYFQEIIDISAQIKNTESKADKSKAASKANKSQTPAEVKGEEKYI
jgi:hypothetical protein